MRLHQMCHSKGKSIDGVCQHKGCVCVWWGVSDGRVVVVQWERGAGPKRGDVSHLCWIKSQSASEISLELYPAETFDMEIHEHVNIWT